MADITPHKVHHLTDDSGVMDALLSILLALDKFTTSQQIDVIKIVADVLALRVDVGNIANIAKLDSHTERMKRLFDGKDGK